MIQKSSGTPWEEMYRVFNMGHRMELYVDQADAQSIIDIAAKYGIEARIIGFCKPATSRKLTIKTEFGEFNY